MKTKKQLKPNWALGFLGFMGILGIPAIIVGDWLNASWISWFVWFIYFIPIQQNKK